MKIAKWIIGALGCFFATGVAAQDQKLPYPPADAPLYLECKMQGAGDRTPVSDWPGLALYFPNGTSGASPEMRIIDQHNQLEGGKFGFHIKAEGHWSLIDSVNVPNSDGARTLPQIMFLPPSGQGENLKIYFLKNGEPVRSGVCFGMIGPNTTAAFEESLADPSGLD